MRSSFHHAFNSLFHPPFLGGWLASVFLSAVLLVAMAAPAFVGEGARLVIMEAFSSLCHQIAERSPHWDGTQLAACHRCLGIYAGLLAGSLAFIAATRWSAWIKRHTGPLVIIAGSPAAIDWLAGVSGVWMNTPTSRVVTGAIFGIAAGLCLARALAHAFGRSASRDRSEVPQ